MNEAVFKTTVMGGFNKGEVLAFIDKQDAQFKGREKEFISRIDTLSTGLKNETQRGAQLTERVAELESQLESEKAKYDETAKALQAANDEAGQAKSGVTGEIERRNAEITRLRSMISELTGKVGEAEAKAASAAGRAEELQNKLELIDKTEDQIGRAMLEAQKTADKIVDSAKAESEELLSKARKEAEDLVAEAKKQVRKIDGDAQEKLDAMLSSVADYNKLITGSRTDAAEFFATVDSVFASMQSNAGGILNKFSSAFKPDDNQIAPDDAGIAMNAAAAMKFDFSADDNEDDGGISD